MFARFIRRIALTTCAAFACSTGAQAANCGISASPVNFGTYSPFSSTATTSSGSVTVSCLVSLTATITIGTGSSGAFANRTMLNGTNPLLYNLFIDSGDTMVWGDGTAGTSTQTIVLTSLHLSSSLPVYGKITARQDAPVGTFSDTLVTTVNF